MKQLSQANELYMVDLIPRPREENGNETTLKDLSHLLEGGSSIAQVGQTALGRGQEEGDEMT